ncbi:Uncharacterised protein [Mycobacteroides abscessus]|nr:Uncharacterised protein [Mycobacteroides abscessus]
MRASASHARSSSASPDSSICTRIRCASACRRWSRPASKRGPRPTTCATHSRASCAATRQRRAPRGSTSASDGSTRCDHTARRSTSAIRTSPLSRATSAGSVPRRRPCAVTICSTVVWVASTSPRAGSTSRMYRRKLALGPTTVIPARLTRSRWEYSRYAARCSPTAVLPVPGAPCTTTVRSIPLRTMTSCSGWMVATMSRIGPVRGRSISASRIAEGSAPAPGAVSVSSSKPVRAPRWKP